MDVQAWKKILLGTSVSLTLLVGVTFYGANIPRVNAEVADYFRNIGYETKKPESLEELGFATDAVPIFDGYRHDKKAIGELTNLEVADIILKRTNGKNKWYYVSFGDGGRGWVAGSNTDFHPMGINYDNGDSRMMINSYVSLMIDERVADEKFLVDALQKTSNWFTRESALEALSKMDISPATDETILHMGYLYKEDECFITSSGGQSLFKLLGKVGNQKSFSMMVDAFLRGVNSDRCNWSRDESAITLRSAARTPEQIQYLKDALRPDLQRYRERYDGLSLVDFLSTGKPEGLRTKIALLYQAMPQ